MAKSVITWAMWILISFAVFVWGGGQLILAAILLAVPILSVLSAIPASRKVSSDIICPGVAEKSAKAECVLRIENASILPFTRIQVELEVKNMLTGEAGNLLFSAAALPKRIAEIPFAVECLHCGRVEISCKSIKAFDILGLAPIRARTPVSQKVTVMPDMFFPEITVAQNDTLPEDSDAYSQEKPGWDYSETFQIRDYAEGDSPKQIHWKLTTKFDRLIVRDPGLPIKKSILVFWEKSLPVAVSPDEADATAEVAVSVCRAMTDGSVSYQVAWNDPGTGICRKSDIAGMPDLSEAIPGMLSVGARASDTSGIASYIRLYGEPKFSHIIYISAHISEEIAELSKTRRVTALLCGENLEPPEEITVLTFTPGDYEQALFDMPIY